MKEFYVYMAVIIIWSSFLTYIDLPEEKIFRSSITLFLVFGLNQLIQIKNKLKL